MADNVLIWQMARIVHCYELLLNPTYMYDIHDQLELSVIIIPMNLQYNNMNRMPPDMAYI